MAVRKKVAVPSKKYSIRKAISRRFANIGISLQAALLCIGIPFVLSLSFGLFISAPAPDFSTSLSDWRDSGYSYWHDGGFEIFYQDIFSKKTSGTGPTLLLLHGFPTSSYDWKKVIFMLTGHFGRIIAVDMLGFGFSDKPPSHNYTVLEQAIIHEKILESCGIKHIHLLAHDLGDTVAQEMLARFMERNAKKEEGLHISSLCLTNGGILPETHRPRLVQKLLRMPVIGSTLSMLMNYLAFSYSFSEIFGNNTKPTSSELWNFWSIIRYKNGHLAAPGLLKYIDERNHFRERWVGALQKTDVPLHLIYGAKDPVNQVDSLELFRRLVPQSTVTVLPDSGHYPQWEDPKGFLKGYYEFLDRIGVTKIIIKSRRKSKRKVSKSVDK